MIRCAECGERFGRAAGNVLTTPSAAAEYDREQRRIFFAKVKAVFARRAAQQSGGIA